MTPTIKLRPMVKPPAASQAVVQALVGWKRNMSCTEASVRGPGVRRSDRRRTAKNWTVRLRSNDSQHESPAPDGQARTHNATEVAETASEARHEAVVERVEVRDEGEDSTVGLEAKDGHEDDEADLDAKVGIRAGVVARALVETHAEREAALKEAQGHGKVLRTMSSAAFRQARMGRWTHLLATGAEGRVEHVRKQAAEEAEADVHEAVDGSVVASLELTKVGIRVGVRGVEDRGQVGVDGKLEAERENVEQRAEPSLRRGEHLAQRPESDVLRDGNVNVGGIGGGGLLDVGGGASRLAILLAGDVLVFVKNDVVAVARIVSDEYVCASRLGNSPLLHGDEGGRESVALRPLASRAVGAEPDAKARNKEQNWHGDDSKGSSPSLRPGEAAVVDEGLEQSDLDDKGDTATAKRGQCGSQRGSEKARAHPRLPQPPARALAEPTTFLSKKAVVQAWQGTNVAPRIPMKKLCKRSVSQFRIGQDADVPNGVEAGLQSKPWISLPRLRRAARSTHRVRDGASETRRDGTENQKPNHDPARSEAVDERTADETNAERG